MQANPWIHKVTRGWRRRGSGARRLALVALFMAGGALAGPGAKTAAAAAASAAALGGPRPLTDVEREGAQLAVEYLTGGPEAWWPHLSRGSWLRALGHDAAVAEIEVRAGSPAGSHWTLQTTPPKLAAHAATFVVEFPSGADDTLLVDMVAEGGGLKIDSLRTAGEARPGSDADAGLVPASPIAPGEGGAAGDGGDGQHGGAGVRRGARGMGGVVALIVGGLVVLAWGGWLLTRRRPATPPPAGVGRASFVAVAVRPRRPWAGTALAAAGIALLGLGGFFAYDLWRHGELGFGAASARQEADTAGVADERGPVALRSLLPLRRALTQAQPGDASTATAATAAGATTATTATTAEGAAGPLATTQAVDAHLDALAAAAGQAGAAARAALVWRAQHRLDRGDLAGADAMLRRLPAGTGSPGSPGGLGGAAVPLAELLRARLALARLQPLETAVAYEHALAAGIADEGLMMEAVQVLFLLGFEDTAKRYLRDLAELGARGSEPYFDLADLALIDNHEAEAHRDFRLGWGLQPIGRAELMEQSLSPFMLKDRDLRRTLSLGTYAEPLVACDDMARRPLALPAGVSARLLGQLLRLTATAPSTPIGGAGAARAVVAAGGELRVPGACDLAPAGTPQDGATAWHEERQAAALAIVADLRRTVSTSGALAQPVLRKEIEDAAEALAERRRWPEVVEITAGLADPAAVLPPTLVRLRALALTRLKRQPEARQLLVRLALGDKASRRADPAALYQLASLLETNGDFDQAIGLVAKANSELPSPPGGDRILQLQMGKRLASSMERYKSPHFVVLYPLSRGPAFAQEAARILEAERTRLQKWIPLTEGGEPIEVRLLPWQDFNLGYSQGGEVAGLFDGVIRLPLGNLKVFFPLAVSIMTHELTHAMIDQRTGGKAPHWFHEGLAQHLEMTDEGRVNSIADYRARDGLLAFPLIEPALQSFSSAVWVEASYDEALWTLNYVESRYGVGGIHRLLDAFRAGQTTSEALSSALGTTEARFDADLWEWCTTKAPRSWRVDMVRYDGGEVEPKRF